MSKIVIGGKTVKSMTIGSKDIKSFTIGGKKFTFKSADPTISTIKIGGHYPAYYDDYRLKSGLSLDTGYTVTQSNTYMEMYEGRYTGGASGGANGTAIEMDTQALAGMKYKILSFKKPTAQSNGEIKVKFAMKAGTSRVELRNTVILNQIYKNGASILVEYGDRSTFKNQGNYYPVIVSQFVKATSADEGFITITSASATGELYKDGAGA